MGAFGKLENIYINHTLALAEVQAQNDSATLLQAYNVPSLVSMALIANTTAPTDRWTADVSYAMPEYEKTSPPSLNINWLFASRSCTYTQHTGINYGTVDVTYSSTKNCVPLPVQDVFGQ